MNTTSNTGLGFVARSVEDCRSFVLAGATSVDVDGTLIMRNFDDLRVLIERPPADSHFYPGHVVSPLPHEAKYKVVGHTVTLEPVLSYFQDLCKKASLLGFNSIVIGCAKAREVPVGFNESTATNQFREFMEAASVTAKQYNLNLLLEVLSSGYCNFITNAREAVDFLSRNSDPNVGILLDSYHAHQEGLDLTSEIFTAGDLCNHIHVSSKDRLPPIHPHSWHPELIKMIADCESGPPISVEAVFRDPFAEATQVISCFSRLKLAGS